MATQATDTIQRIYEQNVARLALAIEKGDRNAEAAFRHIVESLRARYNLGTGGHDAETTKDDQGAVSAQG